MVEVTGLEPAASASRTQRSTKLSHTSINNKSKYLIVVFITSIALLLRLYVITVRKIDSFIIIYSLPLNVNNFFYKTIIFFKKDA